jgi:hypothetical protein
MFFQSILGGELFATLLTFGQGMTAHPNRFIMSWMKTAKSTNMQVFSKHTWWRAFCHTADT